MRKTAYDSLGKILNGLSVGALRNYESQLVGLLLNGLSDEAPEIAGLTTKLLEDAGLRRKLLAIELDEKIED